MYSGNNSGNATAVIWLGVLGFICLAVWWIESRFSPTVVVMILGGLVVGGAIVLGFALASANTRHTLDSVAKFIAADAQVDRYRMGSMKEIARGDAYMQRAAAQMQLVDHKRIDQLAQQRAGLLVDLERQRQQPEQGATQWGWDEDGAVDGNFTELE